MSEVWWFDRIADLELREVILREALERIADGNVGSTMGGTDGELLRLSRLIARDALLRAGKGEERTVPVSQDAINYYNDPANIVDLTGGKD